MKQKGIKMNDFMDIGFKKDCYAILCRVKAAILGQTLANKNRNYGGGIFEDSNLVILPAKEGMLLRLEDKINRLTTLAHGEPDRVDEPFSDTMLDMAGYAVLYDSTNFVNTMGLKLSDPVVENRSAVMDQLSDLLVSEFRATLKDLIVVAYYSLPITETEYQDALNLVDDYDPADFVKMVFYGGLDEKH